MLNLFTKHRWVHCWGTWSKPFKKDWHLNSVEGVKWFQQRTCRVCGKVEARELTTYDPQA